MAYSPANAPGSPSPDFSGILAGETTNPFKRNAEMETTFAGLKLTESPVPTQSTPTASSMPITPKVTAPKSAYIKRRAAYSIAAPQGVKILPQRTLELAGTSFWNM